MSTASSNRQIFVAHIPADFTAPITVVELKTNTVCDTLASMYRSIGCTYVERIRPLLSTDENVAMWVDEEGKINGSAVNIRASIIAGQTVMGNALLCGDEGGEVTSLRMECPKAFIDRVQALGQQFLERMNRMGNPA